jgi:hypothetical protein
MRTAVAGSCRLPPRPARSGTYALLTPPLMSVIELVFDALCSWQALSLMTLDGHSRVSQPHGQSPCGLNGPDLDDPFPPVSTAAFGLAFTTF